uniref:Uncharacterized protein n=1 Tax=Romanomermis culicivorax TaxID=13658 RepID=A0A915IE09_ROMCU
MTRKNSAKQSSKGKKMQKMNDREKREQRKSKAKTTNRKDEKHLKQPFELSLNERLFFLEFLSFDRLGDDFFLSNCRRLRDFRRSILHMTIDKNKDNEKMNKTKEIKTPKVEETYLARRFHPAIWVEPQKINTATDFCRDSRRRSATVGNYTSELGSIKRLAFLPIFPYVKSHFLCFPQMAGLSTRLIGRNRIFKI